MRKITLIISILFISVHLCAQKGFNCDMSDIEKMISPTEKCIIECIKNLSLEKYLGHQNVGFFDSLMNCSFKKVILLAERKGYYYTTVVFSFTDNLQIRLYFKNLQFGNKSIYHAKKKWDPKLVDKEIPFKLKIYHFTTPFCEMESLENKL